MQKWLGSTYSRKKKTQYFNVYRLEQNRESDGVYLNEGVQVHNLLNEIKREHLELQQAQIL